MIYNEIADMAAERIKAAITETWPGDRPVKAILDSYNPTGSTRFVNFTTSKDHSLGHEGAATEVPHQLGDVRQRLGGRVLPRRGRRIPKVRAYVKNHNLGLEVPYLMGSTARRYTCPTSSSRSTTAMTTRSTSSSRSRAIAARTPRRSPTP